MKTAKIVNSVVKIEYKVTAYAVVCDSSELDDDSIIERAEYRLGSIPEKDFDWAINSVEITNTDKEFKHDCCIGEYTFNQLLSRK